MADLVSRIVECNHWQGEEPYDSERAIEITHAIAELRCASLDADESAALKFFGHVPGVRNAITTAKEIYL